LQHLLPLLFFIAAAAISGGAAGSVTRVGESLGGRPRFPWAEKGVFVVPEEAVVVVVAGAALRRVAKLATWSKTQFRTRLENWIQDPFPSNRAEPLDGSVGSIEISIMKTSVSNKLVCNKIVLKSEI
jgi:hypothetical protein